MTQDQLKNIYEALGELKFRYHGQLMYVRLTESGEYELTRCL